MLSDKHLKVLSYSQDSRTVFGSSVSISGGVAITYHDATAEYEPIGIFQPFNELKTILDKISNDSAYASLGEIVFIQTRLNLDVLYKEHPEYEFVAEKQMFPFDKYETMLYYSVFKKKGE